MNYQEFVDKIKDDKEAFAKIEKAIREANPTNDEETAQAASAAAKELGYDVPASEFMLSRIGDQELDMEELSRVAGGKNRGGDPRTPDSEDCLLDYACKILFNMCIYGNECAAQATCDHKAGCNAEFHTCWGKWEP